MSERAIFSAGESMIYGVVGTVAIEKGHMVAQLAADGTIVAAGTALSGPCIGVAQHSAAVGAAIIIETNGVYLFENGSGGNACTAATLHGYTVYCGNSYTIYDNSAGGTLFSAGQYMGIDADGKVKVKITPGYIVAADTDIALLQASGISAAARTPICFTSAIVAAGTPLAAFADNASSNPGLTLVDSKSVGIRWNNNAVQAAVWTKFTMPADIDTAANATLEFLVSKSGATVGDAVKITATAFNQVATALHDADTDFGGDSSALVGNATAKTVSKLTLTLTAADLAAAGSAVSLSFKPKDGTLGTDDAILHGVNLVYKRKLLS